MGNRCTVFLVCASLLGLVGCEGGGDDDDTNENMDAGGGDGGHEENTDAAPPLGRCGELTVGEHVRTLEVNGEQRRYIVEVPELEDDEAQAPLVIHMHGFGWDSMMHRDAAERAPTLWADAGYLRVYPDGLEGAWNAGTCCVESEVDGPDDVAFIRALVQELTQISCVDDRRVYATGASNGGIMAYRLACEASDLFAAVAPVIGVLGLDPQECEPERPIPLIAFNGTGDLVVPYEGGDSIIDLPVTGPFASVADSIAHFVEVNGCDASPTTAFTGEVTTCERYGNCDSDSEVILCTSEGGGHCWPGRETCEGGTAVVDISANAEIIEFFSRHSLPRR